MITPKVPHICYGGDYNPEQWPEEVWQEDVRLMREAGVSLVTVGVFSWALLEPRPGAYDFGWLDRALDLLYAHGVHVDLATATASPPPWLAKRHPESLPVSEDGMTLWPGGRQQYCPSSSAYREAASALVRQIASRYRAHPALAMWHINNEYGCHVAECYCDVSAAAFREWLARRYGTLAALNAAWGTAFWSQQYADWDEITPPRRTPTFGNPTQQLDFRRFSSDALLALFEMERAILKEITPDVPVTTNFMGFFKPVDYWKWAGREDLVAEDAYPDPSDSDAPMTAAMRFDLMRSQGGDRPWMLMEQAPSAVNWRAQNVPKRPGQMRLWSLQAVARGAEGVMFFQWRASRAGAEKFHSGMLPHAGPQTRIFREVAELGADLRRLDPVRGARVPAEVAILFDWESWWALELDARPSASVRLLDQVVSYYRALYAHNIAVDLARPEGDLTRYKLVLAPNLYLVKDGIAENLERFVAAGGTLVMSFFSGIVDERDHILLGGYPAPFRKLLGLRVEEFAPALPGQTFAIATATGDSFQGELWSEAIVLEGAEALASFQDRGADRSSELPAHGERTGITTEDTHDTQDTEGTRGKDGERGSELPAHGDIQGRPAVTRHRFGKGRTYYLGTRPEPAYMDRLLLEACAEAGIALYDAPAGVEVVRRVEGDRAYLFALNHGRDPVELPLAVGARDLLTGRTHAGSVPLAPLGAAVLQETESGETRGMANTEVTAEDEEHGGHRVTTELHGGLERA